MMRVRYITNPAGTAAYLWSGEEKPLGFIIWEGRLAEQLGLPSVASFEQFSNMLNGLHPLTGTQMTPRHRSDARGGIEIMVNFPKSFSILALLSPNEQLRQALMDDAYQAVRETMQDMEALFAVRDQRGGQNTRRIVGNGLWCAYAHPDSRPVDGKSDPGFHFHVIIAPYAHDPERGRFMSLEFEHIRRQADRFETDVQQRLMDRLYRRGLPLRQVGKYFEIDGIPDSLLWGFSRRRQQINERAESLGLTTGKQRTNLGATTRDEKDTATTLEAKQESWWGRMTDPEREDVAAVSRGDVKQKSRPGLNSSVDWALRFPYRGKPKAKEKDIVDRAVARGLGNVKRCDAEKHIRRLRVPCKRGWLNLQRWRQAFRHRAWSFMRSLDRGHERGYKAPEVGIGRS